jgi:hypothetical protein
MHVVQRWRPSALAVLLDACSGHPFFPAELIFRSANSEWRSQLSEVPPAVEIKPAPDGDGFCLRIKNSDPIWFAHEHQAIGHAQEVFPMCEIVVHYGEGILKRRNPASNSE